MYTHIDNRKASQTVKDLLAESEKAIREGNSRRAYQLTRQATELTPDNVEAWLLRATLAPTLEERIACVNRINELAPGYPDRYHVAFFALKDLLDRKPFLAYLEETDELYRVLNADRLVLSIPKQRAPVNPAPPEQPPATSLRPAYRWLTISILGLLFAGIGTVIFAPLAVVTALRAYQSGESRAERVSSIAVVLISFGLFMLGMVFGLLFLLHWMG